MKRLLLLTAIFLSGCAEVQQNIKNSIHKEKRDIYDCFLGTGAYFAFSFFCLKKGDEWGVGAFILWALVSLAIASYYGTL